MTKPDPCRPRLLKAISPVVLVIAWLIAAAVGLALVWHYATQAGFTEAAPSRWPGESHIARESGLPELVLFAHPRCPCTEATLGELAVLMAQSEGRLSAHVVFYHPPGTPESWARTSLWEAAAAIPGVRVMADEGGSEAALFHASVSGQAQLYAADGTCLFAGGITAARGHAGDNAGRAAVLALLQQRQPRAASTPVFGCSLLSRSAAAAPAPEGAAPAVLTAAAIRPGSPFP